ncbi:MULTISPECIES: protein kinase domain-containing protein [Streptomyces]|uniref:non-specific serine/threonine protein kinase n=1 Tax=Streptomyces cyaneofuscatus TaxID=66883 RepID=A0ABZ1F3X4_9ACTN|nr:protein kinase [Streptomyces cyaneofuscatus]WSB10911.1 protein kinase [Streptomyces cyaneofuscatus]WSD45556.1 protein kinase [Streptomyces cyaneofuscatus]
MNATPLSPDDPAELGGFTLLGRIGHGGMGQVYLGESAAGEAVAVKVIKPTVVDSETRQRFAQEIEVLKTVWGPRVAAFVKADTESEQPWLATEYVEGPDLRRLLDTRGVLSPLAAASLGATLAEALAGVHSQGLLHRDLKPANILLGPNGPKIIDFGLAVFAESSASLTAPNMVMGTPACMSPEQANGEKPLTAPVDVYALGAVLLFMSTGHYPYQADHVQVLFSHIVNPEKAPDLSGAPEELVGLLSSMLRHAQHDRPTMDEVVTQCVAVIKAHGATVAQARRQLASLAEVAYEAPEPSHVPAPPPTDAEAFSEVPTLLAPNPAAMAPTVPLPQPSAGPAHPPGYTPTAAVTTPEAEPTAEATPQPTPAPRPRPRRSVAALRIAAQLRETYASTAPF